jgi:hypothetical protein
MGPLNCNAEEFTMTAKEIIRSILDATDPEDRDDAAIRWSWSTELAVVIIFCPNVGQRIAEPAAEDSTDLPRFCALRSDRRISRACENCLPCEAS